MSVKIGGNLEKYTIFELLLIKIRGNLLNLYELLKKAM
jgi:hypothetical protein